MRGDRNIRDYFINPVVANINNKVEPNDLRSFVAQIPDKSGVSFYNFETKRIGDITNNILNNYMSFILDKTGCFDKFTFDNYAARHFEFKSRSIAKYLYGDIRLWYFIFLFNDVSHDTDLTYDYLINHGLIMPNIAGLELLEKLLVFKNKIETIDGNDSFHETDF